MQAQITARHFEASPALREFASERVSKLERYYDGITDAHIVLSNGGVPSNDKNAEIILSVYRQRLSAKRSASTYEDAIKQCTDQLRRQILRYKAKLRSTDTISHK